MVGSKGQLVDIGGRSKKKGWPMSREDRCEATIAVQPRGGFGRMVTLAQAGSLPAHSVRRKCCDDERVMGMLVFCGRTAAIAKVRFQGGNGCCAEL